MTDTAMEVKINAKVNSLVKVISYIECENRCQDLRRKRKFLPYSLEGRDKELYVLWGINPGQLGNERGGFPYD